MNNKTTYYATPAMFGKCGYELRQTRFIGNERHPWDICAVGMSVDQLRDTAKILKGSIDWSRCEKREVSQ